MDSEPVTVRIERQQITALDDWRRLQTDLPSRPEAIRRLIELGLKTRLEPPAQDGEHAGSTRADWPDLADAVKDAENDKP